MRQRMCITCEQYHPIDQFCYTANGKPQRECFSCKADRDARCPPDHRFPNAQVIVDGLKLCSRCNEVKPVGDFYRTAHERSGLLSWCKCCILRANKLVMLAKNRDRRIEGALETARRMNSLWPAPAKGAEEA